MKKTRLPAGFTRRHFAAAARALAVRLGGEVIRDAIPKVFSTGSLGWHATEKRLVEVGGIWVEAQVTVTCTVSGSAALPQDLPGVPAP